MKEQKVIHYDSPEAAVYKTGIEGWVSADGIFCGKDEGMARYRACTHKKCEGCEKYAKKGWVYCEECSNKRKRVRYMELPYMEWDGKAPLCTYDGDKYFFDEEELVDWLCDNELNGSDVMLVLAEGVDYRQIDYGYWGEYAHEDWEPPKELVEAVEKVNDLIREMKPHSFTVGKIRTSYYYDYKTEE